VARLLRRHPETKKKVELLPVRRFAAQLNRAAEDLKAELTVDEAGFRWVGVQAHSNARDFVVFEALDEIQKASLALLQFAELISGPDLDPAEPFTRIVGEQVQDEIALWQRKMIELLADLVGFSATQDEAYFRDFLLLAQLEGATAAQRDQEKFYGSTCRNYQHQIDELCREIAVLEAGQLDPTKAWYRKPKRPLDPTKLRPGNLLSSFASRHEHAMPLATASEQGALGYTYGAGFGRVSRHVHVRPGLTGEVATAREMRSGLLVLVVIALNLLARCQETVGNVPDGPNRQLRMSLDGSDAATIGDTRLRGRADVGDLVVVADKVGRVRQVTAGPYDYESYLVRYLTRPFIPAIPEDWHTASEVARLYSPASIRAEIQQTILSGKASAEAGRKLLSLPDAELVEHYGASVATVWESGVGLREDILGQLHRADDD
jgi:hypothetical protein